MKKPLFGIALLATLATQPVFSNNQPPDQGTIHTFTAREKTKIDQLLTELCPGRNVIEICRLRNTLLHLIQVSEDILSQEAKDGFAPFRRNPITVNGVFFTR